jgi:acetoin:2,6-dichlorophenolindophenol oxidoreductase subunit alpha
MLSQGTTAESNHAEASGASCWSETIVAGSSLRRFDRGFRGDLSVQDDVRLMLFIRIFEEALLRLFQEGKVNGTTHTCIGQEYIPVSLMPLLRSTDYIFSNHRGHGHYLARFLDPVGLLCEILGREGAICRGVGGSQHIRRDRYFSTGVQGESVPVGAGVALGIKRKRLQELALTFIGDGTWGEGAVYEALNMASLWSVPLVVVCENNGIAQTTSLGQNMAGSIEQRAASFGIDYIRVEDHEVAGIRQQLRGAFSQVREEQRPLVVEFLTRRLASHSKGDDTRSEDEVSRLRSADWWANIGGLSVREKSVLETELSESVERLVAEVLERPASRW